MARGFRRKWGVAAYGYGIFFFNLEGCKCSKTDCGDGCTKL